MLREVRDLLGHLDQDAAPSRVCSSLPAPPPKPTTNDAGGVPAPRALSRLPHLPGYELLEELARGGMGVVYRARQTKLGRIVALKVLAAGRFADDHLRRRFLYEAAAVAELDHPHIVPVFEFGEHEEFPFFSMALIDGPSLEDVLGQGPMDPRRAATLVCKIAGAVQFAHERGIIHRDLKPANILLDASGEPRVADFGLAKRTSQTNDLTMAGQILGTASFMPPEQAAGRFQEVGRQSDVYSLGATLYCLLCGRPPFHAASDLETLQQVQNSEPPPLRSRNARVSRDLETICHCALQKDPKHRYESAAALQQDLERFLGGFCITAKPTSWHKRLLRWSRRNIRTSLCVLLVILNVAMWAYVHVRESQFRTESQQSMRHLHSRSGINRFERAMAEYDAGQTDLANEDFAKALAVLPESDPMRDYIKSALDRVMQRQRAKPSSMRESGSMSITVFPDGIECRP